MKTEKDICFIITIDQKKNTEKFTTEFNLSLALKTLIDDEL